MLFSGSSYSELPVSSTHQMFLTSNGEEFDIILSVKQIVNILLNLEK